jgi:hypothetical protein
LGYQPVQPGYRPALDLTIQQVRKLQVLAVNDRSTLPLIPCTI